MPELARQRADGVIDRSKTRDTPIEPLAIYEVALVLGTHVAETILASVHVRAHFTGRTYGRNDLIKTLLKHLARRGPSTYGSTATSRPIAPIRRRGAVRSCARALIASS